METTLQLLSALEAQEKAWRVQSRSTQPSLSGTDSHSCGVADGILMAINAIKESCATPDATPVVPPLMKLAAALSVQATRIHSGYDFTQENATVRQSMVLIYTELAAAIQEALQ